MIKDVPANISNKLAIRDIGLSGDNLRVVFDLYSMKGMQLNDESIVRMIPLSQLSEFKQADAAKLYKNDKSIAKVKYEDNDHLVRSTDPFFIIAKEFVDIATKTASEFLNK